MPKPHENKRVTLDEDYMLEVTRHGFRIYPYIYDEDADDHLENIFAGSVILSGEAMLKLHAFTAELIAERELRMSKIIYDVLEDGNWKFDERYVGPAEQHDLADQLIRAMRRLA